VVGEPVTVPSDADEAVMEQCRVTVEQRLVAVTDRAYAIVDRTGGAKKLRKALSTDPYMNIRKDRHADHG
jgi:hypothetical protein